MNWESIAEKIRKAEAQAGKKIEIIAVTKTRSVDEILSVLKYGITNVGENRMQEASEKMPQLSSDIRKHLIGSLQSNKINKAVELFDTIQSVESLPQLEKIAQRCATVDKKMSIMLQVNTSQEISKHGLTNGEDLYPLVECILQSSHLKLEGLMTIGALCEDEKIVRSNFAQLRTIKDTILKRYTEFTNLKLSMGMSADFEWAISEGSDMIRLGRILFERE